MYYYLLYHKYYYFANPKYTGLSRDLINTTEAFRRAIHQAQSKFIFSIAIYRSPLKYLFHSQPTSPIFCMCPSSHFIRLKTLRIAKVLQITTSKQFSFHAKGKPSESPRTVYKNKSNKLFYFASFFLAPQHLTQNQNKYRDRFTVREFSCS